MSSDQQPLAMNSLTHSLPQLVNNTTRTLSTPNSISNYSSNCCR
jgi:hypothetical protein